MFGTSKHCVHRLSSAQMAIHIVLPFCMLREPLFHRHLDSTRHTIFFVSFSPKNNSMHTHVFWDGLVFCYPWWKCNYILLAEAIMALFLSISRGNVDRCARIKGVVTVNVTAEQRQIGNRNITEKQRATTEWNICDKQQNNTKLLQLIVSSCFPILSPAPCWLSFWLKRRKCRKKKMKLLGKNLFF